MPNNDAAERGIVRLVKHDAQFIIIIFCSLYQSITLCMLRIFSLWRFIFNQCNESYLYIFQIDYFQVSWSYVWYVIWGCVCLHVEMVQTNRINKVDSFKKEEENKKENRNLGNPSTITLRLSPVYICMFDATFQLPFLLFVFIRIDKNHQIIVKSPRTQTDEMSNDVRTNKNKKICQTIQLSLWCFAHTNCHMSNESIHASTSTYAAA